MRKSLIFSVLFLAVLFSPSALAETPDFYELHDYFFDINQNEVVYVLPFNESYIPYFVVDSSVSIMGNDSNKFIITVSSNETGDNNFYTYLSSSNGTYNVNSSDLSGESEIEINDSKYYYIKTNRPDSQPSGYVSDVVVCAELKKKGSARNIRFFSGNNVSGKYEFDFDGETTIDTTSFDTYCSRVLHDHSVSVTNNSYEIHGFTCTDCSNNDNVVLSVDTGSNNNESKYISDINLNITEEQNETTGNYIIFGTVLDTQDSTFISGTMRWRDPFYVNFSLFYEKEDNNGQIQRYKYGDEFDYLYAIDEDRFGDAYVSDNAVLSTANRLPDFGVDFELLNFARHREYVFQWGEVINGDTQIKFYEPGNYSLYLRNVDQKQDKAIDEFDKPEFSEGDIDTSKLTTLDLNGSDTSYSFVFNEMDIRAWEFYRNAIVYFFTTLVLLVVTFGLFYMGLEPKAALITAFGLWTIVFGVVGSVL